TRIRPHAITAGRRGAVTGSCKIASMVSQIPWPTVVANLDNPPNRGTTADSLRKTLGVLSDAGRLEVVDQIAGVIPALQTPEARVQGLSVVGTYARDLSSVRMLANALSSDANVSVRSAAVSVL